MPKHTTGNQDTIISRAASFGEGVSDHIADLIAIIDDLDDKLDTADHEISELESQLNEANDKIAQLERDAS